jgi:hypothetical protein
MKLFEITNAPTIERIEEQDKEQILQMCVDIFHGKTPFSDEMIISYTDAATDWALSKKMAIGDKLIGFYLLAEGSIYDIISQCKCQDDVEKFAGKRGIEGIILGIIPEYRGGGLGDRLKNLPKSLGYDYVFGQQFKSLNNLEPWLKRRELVADCGQVWVTAEIF